MLALSTGIGVALLVLGGIFVAVAGGTLVLRGRQKETGPDIPSGMRPGPADAALETPLLHKLQGWAVILVAFSALWIPLNWLREPSQNLAQERTQEAQKIERGHDEILYFSEENQLGVGCIRCHGPELRGGVIQSGANPDGSPRYIHPANLTTVCGGPNTDHGLIHNVEDIRLTLAQGRVAAGMPSWGIRYAGALDDQQIDDLVQYIVSINRETVPFATNVCVNPKAPGYIIPGGTAATSGSASPSGSATPTSGGATPSDGAPSGSSSPSGAPGGGA